MGAARGIREHIHRFIVRRGSSYPGSALIGLALEAALLPLLIAIVAGIGFWTNSQRNTELQRISGYSETLARALDRELRTSIQAAEIVAGSQFLTRGDINSMEVLARDAAKRLGGHFVIMDRRGHHLMNTLRAANVPLGATANLQSLDDAFAAGRPIVYGLVTGTMTGSWQFGVLVPVTVAGEERYVLAYVPPVAAVQKLIEDLVVPEGWLAAIIDGQGRLVARSEEYQRLLGRSAAADFVAQLVGRSGQIESTDLTGRQSYTAYTASAESRWKAVVWVPRSVVDAPGRTAVGLILAALIGTLLLSVLAAHVASRLLRQPVQQLLSAAEALGQGAPVEPIATRMREASIIGAALHDASRRIARRDAELARSAAQIRESEQRYKELVEGLSDAVVWEGDPEALTFTFVSDAATSLLGHPAQEWLSNPRFWSDHLHPEDREQAIAYCQQETAAGRNHDLEYRMVAADGRTVWVRDTVYISYRDGKRVSRGLMVDITKWKQAEAVLRDRERRFREMTENAPVMIWMSDASGRCIHLNRPQRAFWDVEDKDLATFNWSSTVHPEDAREIGLGVAQAVAGQTGFSVQGRFLNALGEYRVLKTDALPRFAEDGTFLGLLGVNIDVTEALRTTEALRASEDRLRIAARAAELGVFEWRIPQDEAVFENSRMYEILGHTAQDGHLSKREFMGSYIHPDDAADFENALRACMTPGSTFRVSCRIRRKTDGDWRWIECAGNFSHGTDGSPHKLVGVVADVTDRKRAEEELVRSTALLRAVSDGASDLIFVKDRACRIIFANPATARITGMPMEKLIGTTGVEWGGAAAEVEAFLANDRRVMETGEAVIVEEVFSGTNGLRTYMSQKAPMRDDAGRIVGLIGVSRDITERKQAEEHTQVLLREVSHRAKNMLAVIQAVIRQTAREPDPTTLAERVSTRLAGLAASHDLLVESEWKSVDLRELVRAQLSHCSDLVGSRIRLDGPAFGLRAAATQTLGMAIHELATNASKYGALSQAVGTVMLSWGEKAGEQGSRFHMTWEEQGGPRPRQPEREGFGHSVIVRMVEQGLDAAVTLEYLPTGLRWQVDAPARSVIDAHFQMDRVRQEREQEREMA